MSHPPRNLGGWFWTATVILAATACCVVLSLQPVYAQARDPEGAARLKTESPYFFVQGSEPGVDALPLKGTEVDVRISGVIADVTVVQHYRNEGRVAIEAQYVFPGSTRAAVGGMNVRLANRLITARIREKQQAKIEYDTAKKEGKTAALLEQHRPNVFQMNVANILPGDDVRVELRYTELLVPQGGNYEFVFPTVVGPRYNRPQAETTGNQHAAGTAWTAQPTLRAGVPPASSFQLKVAFDTPLGIREIRSRTHKLDVHQDGLDATHANVALAEGGEPANNRDFVLDYRLAGDSIESGLMLYQGQGDGAENFFLAMVQPPRSVAASAISPRDYIFVVDISGSMHGFPLDTAKTMLQRLIGGLRPSDTFNVLLFSGSNKMLAPRSVPATQANIERALATIDKFQGSGGTELIPALKRVYAEPKAADISRTVVVVTDGYVSVEQEAFALVRKNLDKANLFTFGIGSSVNRSLMEGLARAGMGEPFIITDPVQAPEQAARFRRMIESPVMTSVKTRFEGLDVYDLEPALQPDVLGERPVIVFGKWRGEAKGTLVIDGMSAGGPYHEEVAVPRQASATTSALRALWARNRIAAFTDQEALEGGDSYKKSITALGLQYGLLTQYTSFIAVDQVVRNPKPADAVGVQQPLPLPQGVSELAVGEGGAGEQNLIAGAAVPSTPEPETWGAIAVVLSMLFMLHRRARRNKPHRFTSWARMISVANANTMKLHTLIHNPRFVTWGIRVDRTPAWIWMALQFAALLPTGVWMARRMADGSDDPLGLLALCALSVLVWLARHDLRLSPRSGWLAMALAATVLATLARSGAGAVLQPLPALFAALLAVLALACGLMAFLPPRTAAAPVIGLGVLSLPLLSSLQFYAGYPLRVVTAEASRWLLAPGFEVMREGSSLWVDGQLVIVDAPCSGVQMVWLGYFTACVVALWAQRSDKVFLMRLFSVGLLVLAGNILRNSVLIAFEGAGQPLEGWAHNTLGLAILAMVCGGIAWVMARPQGPGWSAPHKHAGAHHANPA